MDASVCPGCQQRDARITALEQQVAELHARLGTNSSNSSVPPSANPLGAPKPGRKKKSRRRPGGQPGHPPHLKQLLPPERVTKVEILVPHECEQCHADLPAERSPTDPEPIR